MGVENLVIAAGNVSVSATVVAAFESGLVARYTDADNYILLLFSSNTGKVTLYRRETGVWFPLDAILTPVQAGDRFELRCSGTEIRGYRNGESLVQATAGFQSATQCGTYRGPAPDDVLSDFSATEIIDGPPPPIQVKLGPVPAYYPDDLRYADAEMP